MRSGLLEVCQTGVCKRELERRDGGNDKSANERRRERTDSGGSNKDRNRLSNSKKTEKVKGVGNVQQKVRKREGSYANTENQ